MHQPEDELVCPRCGATRPPVCAACGASRFRNARAGVARVREELEALVGEPVGELTATSTDVPSERVVVGTEAVLQRIDRADLVAFLDLDQELLAPRYRAAEQALALVARAARVVAASAPPGARAAGRLLLQTRMPDHEVVQAAVRADVGPVAEAERARRAAAPVPAGDRHGGGVGGGGAGVHRAARLTGRASRWSTPASGRWWLRAPDHQTLCDALAATRRPPGRLRIEVDPLRL